MAFCCGGSNKIAPWTRAERVPRRVPELHRQQQRTLAREGSISWTSSGPFNDLINSLRSGSSQNLSTRHRSGSIAFVYCLPQLPEKCGVYPLFEDPTVEPDGSGPPPHGLENIVHGEFRTAISRLKQVVALNGCRRSCLVRLSPSQPVWRLNPGDLVDDRPPTSTALHMILKSASHPDHTLGELGDDRNVRSAPLVVGHQIVPNRLYRRI